MSQPNPIFQPHNVPQDVELLDAHLHFFYPGFAARVPDSCRRLAPDEFTLYAALAARHNIRQALIVGYEGAPWASGNNAYIANLAAQHDWVRPMAFVLDPAALTVAQLEAWAAQRFVGITFYVHTDATQDALGQVPTAVWDWLVAHGWLVSVNSKGVRWRAWQTILVNTPDLRLLASHLGSPTTVAEPPSSSQAAADLAPLTELAAYPGAHVKISGFYGATQPSHAYPHRATWPYVEVIHAAFGPDRLVWGSDFSPSLEVVSFPQTIDVVAHIPIWSDAERAAIWGGNLARLLASVTG